MTSDRVQQLAISARNGNSIAYKDLHQRLLRPLSTFLSTRFNVPHTNADEIAQQTITEAFQALSDGRYDPEKASFVTFVYSIARHMRSRYVDQMRRNREVALSQLDSVERNHTDIIAIEESEYALAADEIEAVKDCLGNSATPRCLTPEERYVIVGLATRKTFDVLAAELGRSLDTVYRRKVSALEKLRRCMEKKGFR